jgi:hypothetical protein
MRAVGLYSSKERTHEPRHPQRFARLRCHRHDLAARRRDAVRYASASHFIEIFRTNYGPIKRAFASLDDKGQACLTKDIGALLAEHDRGGGHSLVVPGEYLEAVAVRR